MEALKVIVKYKEDMTSGPHTKLSELHTGKNLREILNRYNIVFLIILPIKFIMYIRISYNFYILNSPLW